jgi:hypothetical protein
LASFHITLKPRITGHYYAATTNRTYTQYYATVTNTRDTPQHHHHHHQHTISSSSFNITGFIATHNGFNMATYRYHGRTATATAWHITGARAAGQYYYQ